jgi:hypothetical protein
MVSAAAQRGADCSTKKKAPFPGPFEVAGAGFEPATSGLLAASILYTRSAVFRRNARSKPIWPAADAFRRNTVASLGSAMLAERLQFESLQLGIRRSSNPRACRASLGERRASRRGRGVESRRSRLQAAMTRLSCYLTRRGSSASRRSRAEVWLRPARSGRSTSPARSDGRVPSSPPAPPSRLRLRRQCGSECRRRRARRSRRAGCRRQGRSAA